MYRDVFTVDTTPCKPNQQGGPFQVPVTFKGDTAAYRQLIRDRYASDPHERKCMRLQAFWSNVDPTVQYVGQFADEARSIVKSLGSQVLKDMMLGPAEPAPKRQTA